MRTLAFTLLVLLEGSALAVAADSFDELVKQYEQTKKEIESLEAKKAEIGEKLKAQFAEQQKKLADLGLLGPGPKPDTLKARLLDAYAKDGKPREACLQLAALYKLAAPMAKDPAVLSTKALKDQVNAAAVELMKEYDPAAVKNVLTAVAEEWTEAVGKAADEPITPKERDAAHAMFLKLSTILGGVQ